ncbi:MAG: HdeD family acid-resistance protein [Candidatus Nanopelagicales bacterium]
MSTPEQSTSAPSPGDAVEPADYVVFEAEELTPEEQQALLARIGRAWWLVLILGVVSLLVGILMLVRPFTAVNIAAIIFGIWLLVSGVFQLFQAFDSRLETVSRVLNAITGVIGIVLGIICLESVEGRIELLILFLAIWWIMRGIVQIAVGASNSGGGLYIFLGILGIIAGVVVLVWPIGSLTVLTVVAGIWLVVLGLFEIIAAFRIRSLNKKPVVAVR